MRGQAPPWSCSICGHGEVMPWSVRGDCWRRFVRDVVERSRPHVDLVAARVCIWCDARGYGS